MKAGTVAALTLATMVVSTTHAQSQEKRESAFGFYKGMTLKEAQAAAPLKRSSFSPASYSTESPPKPVFPFASYQVIIGPLSGVCAVIASTDLSPIGSKEAKGTSETVFRLLEKRYGPHTGTNLELGIIGWEDAQAPRDQNRAKKPRVRRANCDGCNLPFQQQGEVYRGDARGTLTPGDGMHSITPTAFAVAVLLIAGSAQAQNTDRSESAFGLTKGMTLKQIKAITKVGAIPDDVNSYLLAKVPQPFAPFIIYSATISPKHGLCYIHAASKPRSLQSVPPTVDVARIMHALTSKYGQQSKEETEGTTTTSVWLAPQGPGTAIEFHRTNFANGTYMLSVIYVFSNFRECLLDTPRGL